MTPEELLDHTNVMAHFRAPALEFIASVGEEASYYQGEVLFQEDAAAERFHIVTAGRVGLELTAAGRPPVAIQTLGPGELLGLSWMWPPHRWNWRARASVDSTTLSFDAVAIRERAATDADLRHDLCALVARAALKRLHSTRAQLLNLYETSAR